MSGKKIQQNTASPQPRQGTLQTPYISIAAAKMPTRENNKKKQRQGWNKIPQHTHHAH